MLLELSTAIITDLAKILKEDSGFMSASAEKRLEGIHHHYGQTYPHSISEYMSTVTAEEFMKDVKAVLEFGKDEGIEKECGVYEAVAAYLSKEFGRKLDELDSRFFFEGLAKRQEKLSHLFPGKSFFSHFMREIFVEGTYQELAENAYIALKTVKDIPTILVQSPVELETALKKEIRENFFEKYSYSFAEFQINPQVIGGMRVFIDGKLMDDSWLSKIQKLSSYSIQS